MLSYPPDPSLCVRWHPRFSFFSLLLLLLVVMSSMYHITSGHGVYTPYTEKYYNPGAEPLASKPAVISPYSQKADIKESWGKFFGLPHGDIPKRPEDSIDRERLRLPDAYKHAAADKVTERIMRRISVEERFGTKYMFPLQRHEDSTTVTWDSVTFNDTLMDRVPEEGVPRMLSFRKTSDSATIHRVAKAFEMEHGFMKTEFGHAMYWSHLEQMANALVETAEYGCMITALYFPLYLDPHAGRRGRNNHGVQDLARIFEDEIHGWAIINKSKDGLKDMLQMGEETLRKRNSERGNLWVLPQGTEKFVNNQVISEAFYETGRRFGDDYDNYTAAKTAGMKYFESRDYYIGDGQANVDPCDRPQTIGTYFYINGDVIENQDPCNYRTSNLDLKVYNETIDTVEKVHFKRVWKYLGLFDTLHSAADGDYAPLSPIGVQFLSGHETWGKFMSYAGGLDYFVDTLMCKSNDVQQHFIDHVINEVDKPASLSSSSSSAPPSHSAFDPFSDSYVHRIQARQGFTGAKSSSSSYDSTPVPYKQVFNVDASAKQIYNHFSDKESAKKESIEAVEFLHSIDVNSNKHLLGAYLNSLSSSRKSFPGGVWDDVRGHLGKSILDVDAQIAADQVVATAAERGYTKLPTELVGRSTDAAAKLKEADRKAPRWLSLGDRTPKERVTRAFVNKPLDRRTAVPLLYESDAYSLSTNNLILFSVSDDELKYAQAHGGEVHVDTSNTGSDIVRSALYQYAITLSLVNAELMRVQNKMKETPSPRPEGLMEASVKEATQNIKLLVNHKLTGTGDESDMEAAVFTAETLKVTNSQSFIASRIDALRDLLRILYSNDRAPDQKVIEKKVAELLVSLYSSSSSSSSSFQKASARVAGAFKHLSPDDDSLVTGISSRLVEEKDPLRPRAVERLGVLSQVEAKKLCDDAAKAVTAHHNKSKELNKVVFGTLSDSYSALGNKYQALYIAAKRAGLKQDIWENWVDTADRLFRNATKQKYEPGDANYDKNFVAPYSAPKAGAFVNIILTQLGRNGPLTTQINGEWDWSSLGNQDAGILNTLVARESDLLDSGRHIHQVSNVILSFKSNERIRTLNTQFRSWVNTLNESAIAADINRYYRTGPIGTLLPTGGSSDEKTNTNVAQFAKRFVALVKTIKAPEVLFNSADPFGKIYDFVLYNIGAEASVIQLINAAFVPKNSKNDGAGGWEEEKDESVLDAALDKAQAKRAHAKLAGDKLLSRAEIERFVNELPITNSALWVWSLKNDVFVPIGGIGFRPHAEYNMATAIHMNGGLNGAGKTFWAWPDFQLADNVSQKKHYGHLSVYLKSVILARAKLLHFRNCYCRGYIRGNGLSFYDPLNINDVYFYKNAQLHHDVFFAPIPANWRPPTHFLDICGSFHKALGANQEAQDATNYPSSSIMRAIWGWKHILNPMSVVWDEEKGVPSQNTICFQDSQWKYNPNSKDFDAWTANKGHWEERIYTGCGKQRRGIGGTLRPMHDETNTVGLTH